MARKSHQARYPVAHSGISQLYEFPRNLPIMHDYKIARNLPNRKFYPKQNTLKWIVSKGLSIHSNQAFHMTGDHS